MNPNLAFSNGGLYPLYHPPRIDPVSKRPSVRGNPSGSSANPKRRCQWHVIATQRQATRPKVIFFLAYACESQKVGNKSLEVEKVGKKLSETTSKLPNSNWAQDPGPSILAPKNHRSRTVSVQKSMTENLVLPPKWHLNRCDH